MQNTSNYLGQTVSVVMDRPLGSKHPKHGFIYPSITDISLIQFQEMVKN